MKTLKDKFIITFPSTEAAIAMEDYCKNNDIPGRLIPVPTQISAGCGLCWCTEPENEIECRLAIKKSRIAFEECILL